MVVGEKRKKLSSKSTQTGAKRCHKAKKAEFFSSTGISCEVNLDQIGEGAALGVARHGRRSLRRAEWKSLKYPVRYAPNVKLTDINRLEYCVEDMYEGSFPASAVTCSFGKFGRSFESRDGRPASGGCYSCGEYKFWIIWGACFLCWVSRVIFMCGGVCRLNCFILCIYFLFGPFSFFLFLCLFLYYKSFYFFLLFLDVFGNHWIYYYKIAFKIKS